MKYRLAALALIVSFLASALAVKAATPMTDEVLFTRTVATMNALPEPKYLTFVTDLAVGAGASIYLTDDHGFLGQIQFYDASDFLGYVDHASWATNYRTGDEVASIGTKRGRHLVTHSPDFSPTWHGVYDLLQYGLDVRPDAPAPASLAPSDSVAAATDIQDIDINFYRVTAANEATCPNGSQGRHLHFQALADPLRHRLTDATIDLASERFCSIRFVFGFMSDEERHFGDLNGYWMTTSMERSFGSGGRFSTAYWALKFTYRNVRFPDTLEAALFAPQT